MVLCELQNTDPVGPDVTPDYGNPTILGTILYKGP